MCAIINLYLDLEGYNEFEVAKIFDKKGNVLYVNMVDYESAVMFSEDKKFSDYIKIERLSVIILSLFLRLYLPYIFILLENKSYNITYKINLGIQ